MHFGESVGFNSMSTVVVDGTIQQAPPDDPSPSLDFSLGANTMYVPAVL